MSDANKKLKNDMATVNRERDTFSKTVTELDKKKGELEPDKSATIKKLT